MLCLLAWRLGAHETELVARVGVVLLRSVLADAGRRLVSSE